MYHKRITKNQRFIILGILIVVSLFLGSIVLQSQQHKRILFVIPHFIIKPERLDTVRTQMAKDIKIPNPIIIIISPDHFATYRTNKLEYDNKIDNVCVQGYCQSAQGAWIAPESSSYTRTANTLILPDHGIGAHLRFIKKWIPNAKIVPLLLQGRSINDTKQIIKQINTISQQQPTIVIGSVDRSHYVPEPWATLHDNTTRSIINTREDNRNQRKKLDVDCPSCLWVINQLAQDDNTIAHLLWRDSSALLYGSTGMDNTSRGIISYLDRDDIVQKNSKNHDMKEGLLTGVTLLMGGDVIYDRGVKNKLPDKQSLTEHFRDRYELQDVRKSPFFTFHKMAAGIDITMINLETPLHKSGTSCYPNKTPYSFCSDEIILKVLSNIGFNTISFANNHRFDAGTQQYETTKKIITEHNMDVVSEENLVKKNIRGIKIALHAYDFTYHNNQSEKLQIACREIQESTQEGYKTILSVHRGEEYNSLENHQQKDLAQKLVTCGARAIIGHHPHVIQSIERIDTVPVIYSLGNFLMDQGFSSETSNGMLIGMTIPASGKIEILTGTVHATP